MTGPERSVQSGVADLVAAIERAAGDLGLAEEPARFLATLEAGAPGADPPSGEPPAATRLGDPWPVELTEGCLGRIERLDGRLRAFITDEATVRRVGHAYEQAAGWWRRRPALD